MLCMHEAIDIGVFLCKSVAGLIWNGQVPWSLWSGVATARTFFCYGRIGCSPVLWQCRFAVPFLLEALV